MGVGGRLLLLLLVSRVRDSTSLGHAVMLLLLLLIPREIVTLSLRMQTRSPVVDPTIERVVSGRGANHPIRSGVSTSIAVPVGADVGESSVKDSRIGKKRVTFCSR